MPDIEEKLELGDKEASAMIMMKQLADNDLSTPVEVNGEELINKTKLFLVAQARNSLTRIIKLTTFMEKLEDKFIQAVSNRLEAEPESITMISLAMETISKCLQDANATVMQVLKDDRLQNIVINTTNIITPDGQSAKVIDANSRDEVRNLAESLLQQLVNIADNNNVIDVEAEETDNEGNEGKEE